MKCVSFSRSRFIPQFEVVEGKAVCDAERFINDEKNIGLIFLWSPYFRAMKS